MKDSDFRDFGLRFVRDYCCQVLTSISGERYENVVQNEWETLYMQPLLNVDGNAPHQATCMLRNPCTGGREVLVRVVLNITIGFIP